MTDVRLTQTGEQTLDNIESFLQPKHGDQEAMEIVLNIAEQAGAAIKANPLMYPVDANAQLSGVQLRRWLDPTGKYICLFRYNAQTDTALLDIFANTRQDWLSLLYLVQISRP
ncbi:hypothetical protein IBT49_23185 [Erwinia sp. S63]|jgi:hypothetical protein|uniref:hypothetical protein n=1 Tax=Erwinia sp. S63 TaxID=2769341 RepID=UPI00190B4AA7|nr:hypothetical protein [Erwinia sp. S63]MBK0098904.1 hypothetical protein [Erwinia sp. S63]